MARCMWCGTDRARLVQVTVRHHEDGTPEKHMASLCSACELLSERERDEVRRG